MCNLFLNFTPGKNSFLLDIKKPRAVNLSAK